MNGVSPQVVGRGAAIAQLALLLVCGFGLLLALPPVVSNIEHFKPNPGFRILVGAGSVIGMVGVLAAARRWRVVMFGVAAMELAAFVIAAVVIVSEYYRPR